MYSRKLEAILLCPTGQDSFLIASVLSKQAIDSTAVRSISELCKLSYDLAGVVLIAEEAITPQGMEELNKYLSLQEAWSDIPIILLTSAGAKNKQLKIKHLEVFIASGNVTLLERPLLPLTLLSATQVALRSRRRQFQVKELLVAQVEATKMRDEFISIASHELKTPLTSLKLQTQMTRRQITRPETFNYEKIQKQLDYTINQIDRLNKLVDDMLDISRISTGKLNLQKTTLNLSSLLSELIERFMPQFELSGSEVHTDITPEVTGQWDAYKIEQVINNLFSNAIRYSPQKPIHIRLEDGPEKIILSVRDEGVGIAPENLDRIFERFERAVTTNSGLGLGLYITRQIVELHHGKISASSTLGKGSTFIIELPHTPEKNS
jgi:signal transduction histidine kinase